MRVISRPYKLFLQIKTKTRKPNRKIGKVFDNELLKVWEILCGMV